MGKTKILIVEDESIIAMDIKNTLEQRGFEVIDILSKGEEIIRSVEECKPDMILMDIILPGEIDGITAAEEIKSRFDIPIIYITAHSDEKTLNRAKTTEPYGYILKPINENELYSTIITALYKYELELKLKEERKLVLSIAETSPSAIVLVDREGKIIFANKRSESLFGISKEEILMLSYNSPEWRITDLVGNPFPKEKLPFRLVMDTGKPVFNIEHAIELPDKGRVLISTNGSPIFGEKGNIERIVFTIEDITERFRLESLIKQQNENLQEQNEELQSTAEELEATNEEMEATNEELNVTNEELIEKQSELLAVNNQLKVKEHFRKSVFDAIEDGISVLDIDLNILQVNYWMERMYSSQMPLVGKKCYTVYQDRSSPCPWCPSIPAIKSGREHSKIVPYPSEENPTGWIDLSAFPLKDNDGTVIGIIEYVKDVTRQKQAEDALSNIVRRNEALIKVIPDMMFVLSRDGTYIDFKAEHDNELAIPPDQIIGKNIKDTGFSKDYINLIMEHIEKALTTGETQTLEYDLKTPKGLGSFEARIVPLNEDEALSIVRDITKRKQAEESLIESEEKYRNVVERATDVIGIVQDGISKYINQRVTDIFGYSPEEVIDSHMSDYVHPDELPKMIEIYKKRFDSEELPPSYETVLLHKDGMKIAVEISGGIINYQGRPADMIIIRDINERKKAGQALRESEKKFRELTDLLPQTVFETDENGTLTFANRYAFEAFGYTQEDLDKGVSALQMISPEDRDRAAEQIMQIISGKKSGGNEYAALRKDGSTFPVIVYSSPIIHENKPAGLRGIIVDITERKISEEKVKASLKEKNVLLQEIHHRVKNNMQVISSLLSLQSRYVSDEKDIELFRNSQNRVRSMALVHEKLYRTEDLARIDFSEYIRSLTTELFRSFSVNPETIRLKIDAKGISLGIDTAIPCALIINELVSNSLKYAFFEDRKGLIKIKLKIDKKNNYMLVVSDNGVGVPEGLDFRNTESLGLQLINILTKQLQGNIELDRKGGTKFTIRFL